MCFILWMLSLSDFLDIRHNVSFKTDIQRQATCIRVSWNSSYFHHFWKANFWKRFAFSLIFICSNISVIFPPLSLLSLRGNHILDYDPYFSRLVLQRAEGFKINCCWHLNVFIHYVKTRWKGSLSMCLWNACVSLERFIYL